MGILTARPKDHKFLICIYDVTLFYFCSETIYSIFISLKTVVVNEREYYMVNVALNI